MVQRRHSSLWEQYCYSASSLMKPAIASDYPTDDKGRWNKLEDGQLVVMYPDREPDLIQIWIEDEPDDDPLGEF